MSHYTPGHCQDIDGGLYHDPGECPGAVVNCSGKCCSPAPMSTDDTRAGWKAYDLPTLVGLARVIVEEIAHCDCPDEGHHNRMHDLAHDLVDYANTQAEDTRAGEVAAEEVDERDERNLRDMLIAKMLGRTYGVRSVRDMAPASSDMALNTMHALVDLVLASDWLAAHDARVRAADTAENERLREAVNREHGEMLDEVYTVDGLTIVMSTIHDLRAERDHLAAFVADVDLSANEQAARLTLLRQELARTEEERDAETERADRLAAGVRELADEWAAAHGRLGVTVNDLVQHKCAAHLRALLVPADDGCTCGHDADRHDRESGCIECRCRETPADDGEVG